MILAVTFMDNDSIMDKKIAKRMFISDDDDGDNNDDHYDMDSNLSIIPGYLTFCIMVSTCFWNPISNMISPSSTSMYNMI